MAPKKDLQALNVDKYFPDRFEVIVTTVDRKELARDPAGASVSPSGHLRANTAMAHGVREQIAKLFNDPSQCGLLWAADEKTGEIAGCVVGPTVTGVTAIREYKDGLFGGTLRGIFKDRAALRPETRKWVSVTFHNEEGKYPYFILHMNIALPQIKQRRRKNNSNTKKKGNEQKTDQKTEQKTEPNNETK